MSLILFLKNWCVHKSLIRFLGHRLKKCRIEESGGSIKVLGHTLSPHPIFCSLLSPCYCEGRQKPKPVSWPFCVAGFIFSISFFILSLIFLSSLPVLLKYFVRINVWALLVFIALVCVWGGKRVLCYRQPGHKNYLGIH